MIKLELLTIKYLFQKVNDNLMIVGGGNANIKT